MIELLIIVAPLYHQNTPWWNTKSVKMLGGCLTWYFAYHYTVNESELICTYRVMYSIWCSKCHFKDKPSPYVCRTSLCSRFELLQDCSSGEYLPTVLIYGPRGAGKTTLRTRSLQGKTSVVCWWGCQLGRSFVIFLLNYKFRMSLLQSQKVKCYKWH